MWAEDAGPIFIMLMSAIVGAMIMVGVSYSTKAEQDHEYRMKQLELNCGSVEKVESNE